MNIYFLLAGYICSAYAGYKSDSYRTLGLIVLGQIGTILCGLAVQ